MPISMLRENFDQYHIKILNSMGTIWISSSIITLQFSDRKNIKNVTGTLNARKTSNNIN
jgi:hypothetical protein